MPNGIALAGGLSMAKNTNRNVPVEGTHTPAARKVNAFRSI